MIENSPEARPQSGLQEADIVFEAIAEAGITRFLAIYQESQPENIGPIRSARPYYVSWISGYDARYIHSGGSGAALQLIRNLGLKDMDHGVYGSRVADRVNFRFAPHNVYSSMAKIDGLAQELSYEKPSEFTAFERIEPAPVEVADASKITVNISGFFYNSEFIYNAEKNNYTRFMAGSEHTDANTNAAITTDVFIALGLDTRIHPNGIHQIYETVGSGDAYVFQNGTMQKAQWEKTAHKESLTLTDEAGEPLKLNNGKTWITAINLNNVVYE